jgi:protein O-mannose beta-1,4-N-acetylglucosaminyltransferase
MTYQKLQVFFNFYKDFDDDIFIQMLDPHGEGDYGHIFKLLTKHPLRFLADLKKAQHITRFEEAYVGNSKIANWYQYGFEQPQGPISNKSVNGHYVRQVASYIRYKLNITEEKETNTLVVFSRKRNRLLLNEQELIDTIGEKYNLTKQFVRMEDQSFAEQVKILSETKIAIGLHGSLLIMSMFLRPGSSLIELYPFAVPSNNYTPYRTLCNLKGMNIAYRAWENKHEDSNVMFPERHKSLGGISHLPQDEKQKIIKTHTVPEHTCCTNPYWLFRIYQDTKVNVGEVSTLIDEALNESKEKQLKIQGKKLF